MKIFYIVYRVASATSGSGGIVSAMIDDVTVAKTTAEQLLVKNPTDRFVVMQAVAGCAFTKPTWDNAV